MERVTELLLSALVRSRRTRHWLDVRRYALACGATVADGLRALVVEPTYADAYLTGDIVHAPGQHGPYTLEGFGLQTFRGATPEDVRHHLLAQIDEADRPLRREIEVEIERAGPAAAWFILSSEGLQEHDAAWALTAFSEAVVIEEAAARLTVIVSGAD